MSLIVLNLQIYSITVLTKWTDLLMLEAADTQLWILVMVSISAIVAIPRPSADIWCATVPSSNNSAVGNWRVPSERKYFTYYSTISNWLFFFILHDINNKLM